MLGGLNWTVGVAGKFILNTLGGLIRLLIPASWAKDGLQVMHWIVAVPDYAGTITSPSGHVTYGFAGINALRDLFMWIGAALLPLTLVYATSRAALGAGHNVAAPVVRVLALAAVLVSYPWWWSQAAAAVNQITQFVLALPPVSHGIYKLMQYAVGGVALGGWQLIDLFLMGAIGVALLGLIFLKVVIILLGALLYAIGPLMIAPGPDRRRGRDRARLGERRARTPDAAAGLEHDPRGRRAADQRQLHRRAADRRPGIDRAACSAACCSPSRDSRRYGYASAPPAKPVPSCAASSAGCSSLGRGSRQRNRLRRPGARAASRGIVAELRGPGRRRDRRRARRRRTAGAGARPERRAFAAHSRHGLLGAGGAVIRTGALAAAPGHGGARRSHPRRRGRRANGSRRHRQLADLEDRGPNARQRSAGSAPILIALRARGGARAEMDRHRRAGRPMPTEPRRSNASSRERPGSRLAASRACRTAKPPTVVRKAPAGSGGRPQATGAEQAEPPRHGQIGRTASRRLPSRAKPARRRGGSRRGRGPDADAAQAERSRALLRPVVARLARRRGRRWAALRGGQDLAARPAPDDHDRRTRADVLRRRAARPRRARRSAPDVTCWR